MLCEDCIHMDELEWYRNVWSRVCLRTDGLNLIGWRFSVQKKKGLSIRDTVLYAPGCTRKGAEVISNPLWICPIILGEDL